MVDSLQVSAFEIEVQVLKKNNDLYIEHKLQPRLQRILNLFGLWNSRQSAEIIHFKGIYTFLVIIIKIICHAFFSVGFPNILYKWILKEDLSCCR